MSFGQNVKVVKPTNLYKCIVSSNCVAELFVEIQSDVAISRRNKVQFHTGLFGPRTNKPDI